MAAGRRTSVDDEEPPITISVGGARRGRGRAGGGGLPGRHAGHCSSPEQHSRTEQERREDTTEVEDASAPGAR